MAGQNNGKQGGQQQDVNQLLKVRREKLANLQEAGQDPFQITKYDVTHHTSDVKDLYNAHEEKLLAGRPAVSTDGMDEAAAREAVKADYEERRSIMDADPIHVSIAGLLEHDKKDVSKYISRDHSCHFWIWNHIWTDWWRGRFHGRKATVAGNRGIVFGGGSRTGRSNGRGRNAKNATGDCRNQNLCGSRSDDCFSSDITLGNVFRF